MPSFCMARALTKIEMHLLMRSISYRSNLTRLGLGCSMCTMYAYSISDSIITNPNGNGNPKRGFNIFLTATKFPGFVWVALLCST
jgi:hypothetical protein